MLPSPRAARYIRYTGNARVRVARWYTILDSTSDPWSCWARGTINHARRREVLRRSLSRSEFLPIGVWFISLIRRWMNWFSFIASWLRVRFTVFLTSRTSRAFLLSLIHSPSTIPINSNSTESGMNFNYSSKWLFHVHDHVGEKERRKKLHNKYHFEWNRFYFIESLERNHEY